MTAPVRVPLHEHPNYPRRACREADPNAFCQHDGEQWRQAKTRLQATARRYCGPCPIQTACREAGRDREWGLWGGVLHRRDHATGKTKPVNLLQDDR